MKKKTNNQGYPIENILNNCGTHMFNTAIGNNSVNTPHQNSLASPLTQKDKK